MEKSLKELLKEQLELKGISMQRLHQLTSVPERYLAGILEIDPRNIPALPYVRGYLIKIGEILGLDGEELWKKYKKETEIKSSGEKDCLPENRYAIKTINRRWTILVVIVVLAIGYATLNAGRILGRPELTIHSPIQDQTITANTIYNLSGKINPRDTLKINGEEVVVETDGQFDKFYSLQPGLNTFVFSVKRLLGKEARVVKQLIYQPQQQVGNK